MAAELILLPQRFQMRKVVEVYGRDCGDLRVEHPVELYSMARKTTGSADNPHDVPDNSPRQFFFKTPTCLADDQSA